MHSFIALPSWGGLYSTSKFAVRGMSESLRLALAPFNIGVSVLCPGLVRTNIAESHALRPAHLAIPRAQQIDDGRRAFEGARRRSTAAAKALMPRG